MEISGWLAAGAGVGALVFAALSWWAQFGSRKARDEAAATLKAVEETAAATREVAATAQRHAESVERIRKQLAGPPLRLESEGAMVHRLRNTSDSPITITSFEPGDGELISFLDDQPPVVLAPGERVRVQRLEVAEHVNHELVVHCDIGAQVVPFPD